MTWTPTRRAVLGGAASLIAAPAVWGATVSFRAAPAPSPANEPDRHGRVAPPIDLPDVPLTLQDGTKANLPSLLHGRAAAIQLMFTECTSTCPIGAATFMQVQEMLPDRGPRGPLLLSIDLGPFGNRPAAMAAWLRRFHAQPGWLAGVPDATDLPTLQAFFGQGRGASDPHSTRVQIVNRSGQLIWRTYEMPSADDLVSLLRRA